MKIIRTAPRTARAALLVGVLAVGATTVLDPGSLAGGRSVPTLAAAAAPAEAGASAAQRTNVIVITTDDMRADDLASMPHTRRLVGRLELTEFVSNHPLCCPARAQLLTGQLAQHNGVHANPGPAWGGYSALRGKNNTVARWFRRSGYSTALVGKFVNGWCPAVERPRGWTDFKPLVANAYSAYRYSYVDGRRTRRAPRGLHTNDFVTTRTLGRIRAYASAGRPFFIWSSFVAPHDMAVRGVFGPPVPAARHRGTMAGVIPLSESKPSYEDVRTREVARALVWDSATCSPRERRAAQARGGVTVRELNQRRLESLQSVDEGVRRIVRSLRERRQLGRTIIVFTSDNGYLLGEHGRIGKNSYYEESLRVPLLARGPGIAVGESAKGAMMADVAPSLAHLAGVVPERVVDGRDDLFADSEGWNGVLVQAGGVATPWAWRGVRTDSWSYIEREDARTLLFDREADPYQLENLAGQRPDVEDALRAQLTEMTS
jgi:N-acetylglucosamine-6-sulfatase